MDRLLDGWRENVKEEGRDDILRVIHFKFIQQVLKLNRKCSIGLVSSIMHLVCE